MVTKFCLLSHRIYLFFDHYLTLLFKNVLATITVVSHFDGFVYKFSHFLLCISGELRLERTTSYLD